MDSSASSPDVSPRAAHRTSSCDSGFLSLDSTQNGADDRFTVLIEGNIGVGKSTFLELFSENEDVEVHSEPVALWKNIAGFNALELMYKDPQRWSLAFQSYVQLTMLEIHNKKQVAPVKLMERSLFSARYCFVDNLHKSGSLSEFDYAVLNEWYNWIMDNQKVHVDLVVYLQSSPEICLERIKKRNRTEEAGVPIEYLQSLHKLHEDWLIHKKFPYPNAPVLVLNADKDLDRFKEEVELKRSQILCTF